MKISIGSGVRLDRNQALTSCLKVLATQQRVQGIMVDFTHPNSVYENTRSAIADGVRPVVGTKDRGIELDHVGKADTLSGIENKILCK